MVIVNNINNIILYELIILRVIALGNAFLAINFLLKVFFERNTVDNSLVGAGVLLIVLPTVPRRL